VRRIGEKLFKDDFYEETYEQNPELLSTIRVPKNLLYLTDRLPKPIYESIENKTNRGRKEETDDLKRRTHDNKELPNIKQKQPMRMADVLKSQVS